MVVTSSVVNVKVDEIHHLWQEPNAKLCLRFTAQCVGLTPHECDLKRVIVTGKINPGEESESFPLHHSCSLPLNKASDSCNVSVVMGGSE